MKNITFSADEDLIRKAREKALREHQSLNKLFRRWLEEWTRENERVDDFDDLMRRLRENCEAGRTFSRDELNER